MPQSTKTAARMTTEQAIRKLFPKRVIQVAKRLAAESTATAKRPSKEQRYPAVKPASSI
jgi:hypothetical protein